MRKRPQGLKGLFSEDEAMLPTDAQQDYASDLVAKLYDVGHPDAEEFDYQVEDCTDIGEMSDLIDEMKEEWEAYR